jgi:uncharacterized protein (TIGR03435 family)
MRYAVFVLAVGLAFAQPRPSFEVATIKPGAGEVFSFNLSTDGRLTARNFTIWNLIRAAFEIQESQLTGGPAWIKERGFDIQAQSAQPVARPEALRMLQSLLEDRFQLKWHREARERSVYALTVAPSGSKLTPVRQGIPQMKIGDIDAPSLSLDVLCQILEGDAGRPVLNRTGLTGLFAVKLQWFSDRITTPDPTLPALATALQEQLGLKLESTKAPVETFVIDSVALPSEN